MFDYVNFIRVDGVNEKRELLFIGLSTCGFCRRGKSFLQDNNVAFSYLFLDELPTELKEQLKADFNQIFSTPLSYPTLILDKETILTGFIRAEWSKELGIA